MYMCVCVYDGIWKEILYTVKIYVFHLYVNFISKEKYKYQIVVNDMHIEVLGEAYWSDAYFEIHWKVGWIDGWKYGEMETSTVGLWSLTVSGGSMDVNCTILNSFSYVWNFYHRSKDELTF